MKKSIALLSVLFFMIILFGIVNAIFLIYEKYSSNNFSNIINQNSELINNIKSILKKTDINSTDNLKSLLTTIPFSSKNGDFRGIVKINLVSNKINLNEYLQNNKINTSIDYFLDKLFEKYEIADPIFLKSLILDTLDKDNKERTEYSEIKLFNKTFPNGYINKKIFKIILNYYVKKTDDKNVYKIPWNDFFIFLNIHTPIYCKFMNKKFFNIFGENSCKDLEKTKIANTLDIIPFNKNKAIIISLDISYILNNQEENFNIIYDLHKKKVINIESSVLY